MKDEIIKRMEEINRQRFFLAMKDNWNRKDFQRDADLLAEYNGLEKNLKNF